MRSGRFGIGALAAFLLGDEIEVTTRHISQPKDRGISFSASLDTEAINARYCPCAVGTEIRVRLHERAAKSFSADSVNAERWQGERWSWYCLDDVTVERRHFSLDRPLKQTHHLPSEQSDLPPDYRRLSVPEFADVQWSWNTGRSSPQLVCNGIRISEYLGPSKSEIANTHPYIHIKTPSVSVFDRDGLLPLNLERTSLNQKSLPFESELLLDIVKDFIGWLFVHTPTAEDVEKAVVGDFEGRYPGISVNEYKLYGWLPLAFTSTGVALFDAAILSELKCWRLMVLPGDRAGFKMSQLKPNAAVVRNNSPGSLAAWFRTVMTTRYLNVERYKSSTTKIDGARVVLHTSDADELIKPRKMAAWVRNSVRRTKLNDDLERIEIGNPSAPASDFDEGALECVGIGHNRMPALLGEWSLSHPQELSISTMAQLWLAVLGNAEIPFDGSERKRLLAASAKELQPYVKAYREIQDMKQKDG
ncbi:MAG: hypothetical protein QM775_02420 [Pirellulales bacterium]